MSDSPRETTSLAAAPSFPAAAAVQEQLNRILRSPGFVNSARGRKLLRWAVNRVLEGDSEVPEEQALGIELFGRPESWDPRTDRIVHAEFARVRKMLRDYYETSGKRDPLVMEIPRHGYTPVFTTRASSASKRAETERNRIVLAIAVGGVLAMAAAGWTIARLMRVTPPPSTVAILPFRDLSLNHQAESVLGGFTSELTSRIAELPGIKVVDSQKNRKPEAGTVIEGSVARSGSAMRVAVQIVRTTDGSQMWTRNFDAGTGSTPDAQSEIAHSVAAALRALLAGYPKAAPRPDPKAYDLFMETQSAAGDSSPAGMRKAATLLERAAGADPRFALAWSRLADSEAWATGDPPAIQLRRQHSAREHYARAVALDPHVIGGTSALAYDHYILDWDWPRTEAELRQSIKVEPGAWPHQMYAMGLATRGQREAAIEETALAVGMEPANAYLRLRAALAMRLAGDGNAAADHIRNCLKIKPGFFLAHIAEGYLALDRNDPAAARKAFERAGAIDPANALPKIGLATALASGGDIETALRIESELARDNAGPLFSRAITHVALGDTEGAITLLEQSAQWHEQQVLWLTSDPLLAPLRNERRFKALVQRTGL